MIYVSENNDVFTCLTSLQLLAIHINLRFTTNFRLGKGISFTQRNACIRFHESSKIYLRSVICISIIIAFSRLHFNNIEKVTINGFRELRPNRRVYRLN